MTVEAELIFTCVSAEVIESGGTECGRMAPDQEHASEEPRSEMSLDDVTVDVDVLGPVFPALPSSDSTLRRGVQRSSSIRSPAGSGDCEREVDDAVSFPGAVEDERVSAEGEVWSWSVTLMALSKAFDFFPPFNRSLNGSLPLRRRSLERVLLLSFCSAARPDGGTESDCCWPERRAEMWRDESAAERMDGALSGCCWSMEGGSGWMWCQRQEVRARARELAVRRKTVLRTKRSSASQRRRLSLCSPSVIAPARASGQSSSKSLQFDLR